MQQQLQLFNYLIPRRTLITHDFQRDGTWEIDKTDLFNLKDQPTHLQFNKEFQNAIIVDIDKNAYNSFEDSNLHPNLALYNAQKKDRCHAVYFLKEPIYLGNNSRDKPVKYARNCQKALTIKLGGDLNYTGLMTKNPNHPNVLPIEYHQHKYSLSEFSDLIDFRKFNEAKLIQAEGRNSTIFETVRHIAYGYVRSQPNISYEELFDLIFIQAFSVNRTFPNPIQENELLHTVKSIARFCKNRYEPGTKEPKIRGRDRLDGIGLNKHDKRVLSAIRTNQQRVATTEEKIKQAVRQLQAQSKKITQKAVADQSGLGIATVKRHKDLIKK